MSNALKILQRHEVHRYEFLNALDRACDLNGKNNKETSDIDGLTCGG